jgi:hypothetical protein
MIKNILPLYNYKVDFMSNTKVLNPDEVPNVEWPLRNIYDDKGTKLNVILITCPFRTNEDVITFNKYIGMGVEFCGMSSYSNFPDVIINPHEDIYHIENKHNYLSMVSAWIHCFREPSEQLQKSGLPLLLLTEADLKDFSNIKIPSLVEKEYDFIYSCPKDNDKCLPGWQSYNRNWDLAKKCLKVMCEKYKLKGIIVGRENCEFTELCADYITIVPGMEYDEFQATMRKCKFIFVPNIMDASPRIITEAFCYNIPALVNYNIVGGWHNIIPDVTGEFFTDENNIKEALDKIIRLNIYEPRKWFEANRGKEISGGQIAKFLIKHFPNLGGNVVNPNSIKYLTLSW